MYLAFHIARYAFPLVITPFLATYLSKDGFGYYAVINSCIWTSMILMEFGFHIYGITEVAGAKTDRELEFAASAVISGKLLMMPIAMVCYAGLVFSSGVLHAAPIASLLGMICTIAYGSSFAWFFQGRRRGAAAVLIEGVPQLGQFCLVLLLISIA